MRRALYLSTRTHERGVEDASSRSPGPIRSPPANSLPWNMTIHPAGRWVFLLPQAAGCICGGLDRSLIDLSFTDGERRRDQAISRPAGHQRCGGPTGLGGLPHFLRWRAALQSVERIGTSGAHQSDGFAAHVDCDPDVDHWITRSVSCSCCRNGSLGDQGLAPSEHLNHFAHLGD